MRIWVIVGFISLILGGCVRIADPNPPDSETVSRLRMWGSTVSNVLKNKLDMVENYKSVREVLNSWEKKELLEMGSRPNLEKDYWAREFKWEVQRKDEELLVKITSAGKNGVWENGGGDDLFVEIRVVRDGQPIVTLNREKTPLAP